MKRRKETFRDRREAEIERLAHLVHMLREWYDIRAESVYALVAERDQLREDLKEALANQREQAERIYALTGKVVPKPEKDTSDPDYDDAMAHAELEDKLRAKRKKSGPKGGA